MDNLFFTEQDKSRGGGTDHTMPCAIQYAFIFLQNLMVDKKLFSGSSQYNSCTNVISYIITEHASTFPHITRLKS